MTSSGNAKQILKTAIARLFPQSFTTLQSRRSRNNQRHYLHKVGLADLTSELVDRLGTTVLNGPFAGMQYPKESLLCRHAGPQLIGCYEAELHPVISSLQGAGYGHVLDIGSAEGYYAVGLARSLRVPVIAFDTESRERQFCKKMAEMNNVADLITLRSWCSPHILAHLCQNRRNFILSDCEGYENALFNTDMKAFQHCDALIELHGDDQNELKRTAAFINQQFSASHNVELICMQERAVESFQELSFLGSRARLAISELRPPGQLWAWCRSINRPS
jgi:hypothetical protein